MKARTTELRLNGRYTVAVVGCPTCNKGVERLEFIDRPMGPSHGTELPQVLFGEVAEAVWDVIQTSARGTQR